MTEQINMDKLSKPERARVRLALHPRKKVLSLKFNEDDVKAWKEKAEAENASLTDWIESKLNRATGRK